MSRLVAVIGFVAERVLASASELNRLDAAAGDGDLGVTMSTAARAVLGSMPDLAGQSPSDVLRICGTTLAREAPSTSGTLLATGLLAAGRELAGDPGSDGATLSRLLAAATDAIASRGGAGAGSKTMLDALIPAAAAAADSARRGDDLGTGLEAAARAADDGTQATTSMVPRFGRAGWLPERSAGHEDPGARLVAIILDSANEAMAQNQSMNRSDRGFPSPPGQPSPKTQRHQSRRRDTGNRVDQLVQIESPDSNGPPAEDQIRCQ